MISTKQEKYDDMAEELSSLVDSMDIDVAGEYPDYVDDGSPSDADPEWSEYLLDQLGDHELINGAPTVDGLRRITEKCFGEIIESRSNIVEPPRGDNSLRCTICHTLIIVKHRTLRTVRIDGCVDVLHSKTPYPFKDHLVATADTRAEGKALRRALKIRVITAEELQSESEEEVLISEEGINDQQILAINQLCKRLDVNVKALVHTKCQAAEKINEINNLEARLLISQLSEFQRKPESIEEEKVSGYDENWKDTFYGSGA
jgi:LSD1 subclass zinc finger protein